MLEKKRLSFEEIEAQAALELPKRDMLQLVTVVITNVLNNLTVDVDIARNNVAVQVCAAVQAINTIIAPTTLTCEITQRQ